eukprot:1159673-Pelagomonas_calceolata.AAC.13
MIPLNFTTNCLGTDPFLVDVFARSGAWETHSRVEGEEASAGVGMAEASADVPSSALLLPNWDHARLPLGSLKPLEFDSGTEDRRTHQQMWTEPRHCKSLPPERKHVTGTLYPVFKYQGRTYVGAHVRGLRSQAQAWGPALGICWGLDCGDFGPLCMHSNSKRKFSASLNINANQGSPLLIAVMRVKNHFPAWNI